MTAVGPPLALLTELTHRCPLRCPYCSNPLELAHARDELSTETWQRVLAEAAALGVLHVHFSGGEPLVRHDLSALVRSASSAGLYVNLITSGIGLDRSRMEELAGAGVDHVQLSLQDADPRGDMVAGRAGAHVRKLAAAAAVRAVDLPLTINWVVHRGNADRAQAVVELALELGAERLEVAHAQLYGWGLANRDALLPSRAQVQSVAEVVDRARALQRGVLRIDAVVPDYYARRPKPCMGGWGRQFMVITPAGKALPCHAAETLPGLAFDSVADRSLAWIWKESPAFARFRGESWLPDLCRECDRRSIDFGGCRCQTLAVTGDALAVDPSCELSPAHVALQDLARRASTERPIAYLYRGRRSRSAPCAVERVAK